jgi:hypothetical protein
MFETKDEVFQQVISQERPVCPHCGVAMSLWEVPDISVTDGLGWGEPYLFVCFNDECPPYKAGWEHMKQNYGRSSSYRCMCYPASLVFDFMSMLGPLGGTGQIVDAEALEERKIFDEKIKKGLVDLEKWAESAEIGNVHQALEDATQPGSVRVRAAEILGSLGGLELIDSLRTVKVGSETLRKKIEEAVSAIHERNFTRECPFCAEIVKSRARICKHCGQDISQN